MMLRNLREDNTGAGFIGFVIPISAAFFLVLIFHALAKVGIGVHPILLEPVFNVWIVFVGVLISVCFFMRQFLILFLAVFGSLIATVAIYILYVI